MATDFSNIIGVFDSFDAYANELLESCEYFSQQAEVAGTAIGAGAGMIADTISSNRNNKSSGIFTAIGAFAGNLIGQFVGDANKKAKMEEYRQEIYRRTVSDRDTYIDMLSNIIETTSSQLNQDESYIPMLKNKILSSVSMSQNDEVLVEFVRDFVTQEYQLFYVNGRAVKIHNFYYNFEKRLNEDVIGFGVWAKDETDVDKVKVFSSTIDYMYNKLCNNTSDEELDKLDYIFECILSKMYVDDDLLIPSCFVRREAGRQFKDVLNKRPIAKAMPSFFYKNSKFKDIFNAVSESFYSGYRIDMINNIRFVAVGIIPLLVTLLYIIAFFNRMNIPLGIVAVYGCSVVLFEVFIGFLKFIQKHYADGFWDPYYFWLVSAETSEFELRRRIENPIFDEQIKEITADVNDDALPVDEMIQLQKELEQSEEKSILEEK